MKRDFRILRLEDRVVSLSVVRDDLVDVVLSFRIRRNPIVLVNGSFTSVVTGEGQLHVAIESLQQPRQVPGSGLDVACLIVEIVTLESFAVAGISCISPRAPTGDFASDRYFDSCWMTA